MSTTKIKFNDNESNTSVLPRQRAKSVNVWTQDTWKDEVQEEQETSTEQKEAEVIKLENDNIDKKGINPTPELTTYGGIKLGWIQGVLIPCLLNIWGVMLFLRIAWIVAQAGIGLVAIIIFVASVVCIITTLSLSAICTNGDVQGGGVYYLVSRSLGAELGASVGIIFAFANSVAASMNTIGFCESLNELLKSHGLSIMDNGVNDTRIVGTTMLLVMCFICAIGMDWATKTQNVLMIVIVLAIINYIIGSCMGPMTDVQRSHGFVGINLHTAHENWGPDFRFSEGRSHNLFSVFAMYFPAVTGVQAGANICGDLKNPASAIPKGTLTALAISITTYMVIGGLAGMGAQRDASGQPKDLVNGTVDACKPHCDYGLHNSHEIMHVMSAWSPLIYCGCWAATLSTALTNLLSVPRLIQALGVDRIYPGLIFFSKPYGRHGEPYRGYVLAFLVSLLFLLIADLNTIAPLISNFYLASYALINFCTFHAAFVSHISWRPTFQYYNTWLSLSGFVMCVAIMVVISWLMALITIIIFCTLYLLVLYKKPAASWGSSADAYRYHETVSVLLNMTLRAPHVKDYSPRPLVLSGAPSSRAALLDLAGLFSVGSFMVAAEISKKTRTHLESLAHKQKMEDWLHSHKYRAFYLLLEDIDFETGARVLLQSAGLGRFSPNILLLGYKTDWFTGSEENMMAYVGVIRYAFERGKAVCILHMPEHPLAVAAAAAAPASPADLARKRMLDVMHSNSDIHIDEHVPTENKTTLAVITSTDLQRLQNDSFASIAVVGTQYAPPKTYVHNPFQLDTNNNLDTWWLYDDGGLNILLPYIIANRGGKERMPLRIFALAKQNCKLEEAQNCIVNLLAMYRIKYTKLDMVCGLQEPPLESSWSLFKSLVEDYKTADNRECRITDEELKKQYMKTSRYLRLREKVLENSASAGLIVMSLPTPKRESVSPALYMAWLEVLCRDAPPMLFERGSGAAVLNA